MQGRLKWLFSVLISLSLISCSHIPGPWSKSKQPSATPATPTTAQASTQGVPKAEIPEKEFNFGLMSEDGSYIHEFKILNSGTGSLEIKEVMAA